MKKLDDTLLLSGNDIPFEEARLIIHNPSIKEIGMYGEHIFHIGTQFLVFSKDRLSPEEQEKLKAINDFDLFYSVMISPEKAEHKISARKVLDILFPGAEIKIRQNQILIEYENTASSINSMNFDNFKNIISQMFCLNENNKGAYNPKDGLAKRIAEKLAKRQEKLAKAKGKDSQNICIYNQYASILSVGLHIDLNDILNYTVYQIRYQMKRFEMNQNFDMYIKSKLAGATDLDEVENWMGEISI